MKLLIDIGHPAHVHYFRNLIKHFRSKGANVLCVARNKDVAIQLLDYYQLEYKVLGKPFRSKIGKLWGLVYFTLRFLLIAIKYKPTIILNATFYSSFTAWLIRKPHFSIEDTFNSESTRMFVPFSTIIFTGNYKHPYLGNKQYDVNSYQELLYLHPNHFIPNPEVLEKLGLKEKEKYTIIRFVSWSASHDYGHTGILRENKFRALETFKMIGKVFISSEGALPEDLEEYRFPLESHMMHDAIAFASLVFGESATMASEAAMLGTPAVYVDTTGRYYTRDQEITYGLVFNFSESEEDQILSIQKGVDLLNREGLKEEWQEKRNNLLKDKIDFTNFLIWFIETYPESYEKIKTDPLYQNKFK